MKPINLILIILGLMIAMCVFDSAFVVDERRQVVVTRFGKVARQPITEPGLNFKIPFIEVANSFSKNLQEWDGVPGQIPTLDKTYIWVDTFARWKIVNPILFFQTIKDEKRAMGRLDDIIDPAVRNMVTSNRLIESVRKSNRELDTFEIGIETTQQDHGKTYTISKGREKVIGDIMEQAKEKLAKFGIEVVDVKIKRINYVEQVRKSVYHRMIAERKQIAEKFRSEGKGEASKILGDKERELKQITSEAYRTAQEIKGKADGEVTKILAKAFSVDPEFYSFTKTLEIYNGALEKNASLILTTDSEFLKYLKGYDKPQ